MSGPVAERFDFASPHDGLRLSARLDRSTHHRARIVLVHGLGEHSGRHDDVARALVGHGFDVARLDLRGHGLSDGKRGDVPSFDAILDDVQGLMREAAHRLLPATVVLWGHSLGGLIVTSLAWRRRPDVAGVVALAPAFRPARRPPRWKLALAHVLIRTFPGFTLGNSLDVRGLSHLQDVVARYRHDPLVHRRISSRLGLGMLEEGQALLVSESVPGVPILVVHGDEDRITSLEASREFARRHPHVELIVRPGAYHELHHERDRTAVLDAALAWIDARLAQR